MTGWYGTFATASLVALSVLTGTVLAQDGGGWKTERDADPPRYAAIHPTRTTLNIDSLVLVCGEGREQPVLQFELYPTDDLPLIPVGADPANLRDDPHIQLSIDGHIYPVSLYFAQDHAIIADMFVGRAPALSQRLLDATARGSSMQMKFTLLQRPAGAKAAFDGEMDVDLQAGAGGAAVSAVRRCAAELNRQISQN